MANIERAPAIALTSLPRSEDLPEVDGGYDADAVRSALDAYRRHALQLQAQLRVLQAAGRVANVEPTGHAVRMDALHLIRAAAEFADALERDAQDASANQIGRTEVEVTRRQRELAERERQVDRYREESERQRNDLLNAARNEAREQLSNASRDAAAELREAEARGARLLEQARHQATELTNAARAEVEQTLDWARQQATAIVARAQQGAEQLLTAAGLGPEALGNVSTAIIASANASAEAARARDAGPQQTAGPVPAAAFQVVGPDTVPSDTVPSDTVPSDTLPDAEPGAEADEPLEPPTSPTDDD